MPRVNEQAELKKIERILNIIVQLSAPHGTFTIDGLADAFYVDRRTIMRDLSQLAALGFRLKKKTGIIDKKRILRFDQVASPLAAPLGFTEDELVSLYLTREIYTVLKGSHFEKAAESAIRKIEGLFGEETAARLRDTVKVKTGPIRNYRNHSVVIRTVTEAAINRKKMRIGYSSASSRKHDVFIIHPYTLLFYANSLYVIGYSEKHREVRTFALERIGQAQSCAEPFTICRDYNEDSYFDPFFGIHTGEKETVKLWVGPEYKNRIKNKILHPSQRSVYPRDGSMEITLTIAGKQDLFKWILSQAGAVKLLEPQSWAKELYHKASEIMRLHASATI
ncbi:MAG: hypothetical protein A2268_06725 [Candidatus Raymondbacteria bacterium RifOxyA12_full_50_37]|uniref:WYL domain-containing protein n=1 Tax=Candidatus Raymondbacteria bacterium RIFOXYD12_FULL_49_13 TaxID=1817890 RepID=A0A1F7F016_UNCRA|nr:MAG: hypothetical protein A2350_00610 [Candidatus Raymondbacteria bacterium RifOxyB12_full_50_8]OGJ87217.1 MAG: hypothetical protein A2268_06725 [Candidatus Raymondbacteria bacterium RifOxyA12_full_50_37]OGJ88788.1 MAG: hypothetical protein A2248_08305 [Candidatus Raymondbacteria bacterium RIFOXYA2_FULL_49_16]OGJ96547.1 MAG: hypothetical protein A2453_03270 [Candidatus Raymondbacteria bacterium RIFOXYC2_FULL_50_21]OGJ99164.1 MAG: hypothetical protein A2487_10325 [Candidatus Raymondbacteria b